jgi:hypothetical protein
MIVLNLTCDGGHCFEGWFASTAAFDEQMGQGRVNCPHCNSLQIERLPSGPHVVRGTSATTEVQPSINFEQMIALLESVAAQSEDVGDRFADEARRMHFEEVPVRRIKGVATLTDTIELIEDGVAIIPLPLPDNKKH